MAAQTSSANEVNREYKYSRCVVFDDDTFQLWTDNDWCETPSELHVDFVMYGKREIEVNRELW